MSNQKVPKYITEEEAWRIYSRAVDWVGPLEQAGAHSGHKMGWHARQLEIDELRAALKQCVKALRFQSSADARDALAAARAVLE